MIQDLHSHSFYSYCGKDSPEAVIQTAIESGIEVLGISDHYYGIVMNKPDFVYENEEDKVRMHQNALKRYYEHIKLLAEKYKDRITVWCGVEITTVDWGYTLMPGGVDVSFFDYCLIENLQKPDCVIDNVFSFATRIGCKKIGLAHMDLPAYIAEKGMDRDAFFKEMAKRNMFWELNVNYDSIHGYKEHAYVKEFFENKELQEAVKKSGMLLSVGFDGHRLEDYDGGRVKNACLKLKELSLPTVE